MTEGVVRLYVRDLLGVNSDVTMHIISSLSSMDEASGGQNRVFASKPVVRPVPPAVSPTSPIVHRKGSQNTPPVEPGL